MQKASLRLEASLERKQREIRPDCLKAFLVIVSMWLENESLSSMSTPKSKQLVTWTSRWMLIEYDRGRGDLELEIDKIEHLGMDIGSCHVVDQMCSLRESWRLRQEA